MSIKTIAWAAGVLVAICIIIWIVAGAIITLIEVADWQAILDFIAPTAAQARDEGWTNIVEGL